MADGASMGGSRMSHRKFNASSKSTGKRTSARGISADIGGRCAGRAMDKQSVAAIPPHMAMTGAEKTMAERIRRDAEVYGVRFSGGIGC
jgi:hypothetical protein